MSLPLDVLESFALAVDRRLELATLVPGTQEHFLFTWLVAEQEGYPADLEPQLAAWVDNRSSYDSLTIKYKNRRRLISGLKEDGSLTSDLLSWLRSELSPSLYNSREVLGGAAEDTTPSALTAAQLEALEEEALIANAIAYAGKDDVSSWARYLSTEAGAHEAPSVVAIFDKALEVATAAAAAVAADGGRRDSAASESVRTARIQLGGCLHYCSSFGPPQVVSDETLAAVLSHAAADDEGLRSYRGISVDSIGESLFPQLTLAQLQRLGGVGGFAPPVTAAVADRFRRNAAWGAAVVARMAPAGIVDFRVQSEAKAAYLAQLQAFLGEAGGEGALPPIYNGLRWAVAFHILSDARAALGRAAFAGDAPAAVENRARLAAYIKLPRYTSVAQSGWQSSSATALPFWNRGEGAGSWQASMRMSNRDAECPLVYEDITSGGSYSSAGILCRHFALPLPAHAEDAALVRSALFDIFAAQAASPAPATGDAARAAAASAAVAAGRARSASDAERYARAVEGDAAAPESRAPWNTFMDDAWLRALQAEARLTRGSDADSGVDAPRWGAQLAAATSTGTGSVAATATTLSSLRDKASLSFAVWNREYIKPAEEVPLTVTAKGASVLSVKVFEVNSTAYYAAKLAEVPSDIDLEGLHAHEELAVEAATGRVLPPGTTADNLGAGAAAWSPLRSYDVALPLASLGAAADGSARRGVFVVEVQAGASSCRAVIRKGALRVVERRTVSGHVLHVMDEDNASLPPAVVSLTLAGRKYSAATAPVPGGGILIPYGARASRQPLIVTIESGGDHGWSFSTLLPSWEHCAESYTLEAAFALEREALVKDNYSATMLVRARLLLHGSIPAPIAALVNTALQLTSVDADGNSSTRVIRPFALSADAEAVVPFAIPPGLRRLTARLTGDYEVMADGSRVSLSAQHEVSLNGMDGSDHTRDVFLRQTPAGGYAIYCLGKTGEPVTGEKLTIEAMVNPITNYSSSLNRQTYRLKTDAEGKVVLGRLPPTVTQLRVSQYRTQAVSSVVEAMRGAGATTQATFELPTDVLTYLPAAHTVAPAALPTTDAERAEAPAQAALPFRPRPQAGRAVSAYVPSLRDVRLVEVRPTPRQGTSLQAGGSGSGDEEVVVRDVLKESAAGIASHVRWDGSLGMLVVHSLPAGDYIAKVKRPHPGARAQGTAVRIRVLPAPAAAAAAAPTTRIVGAGAGSFVAHGPVALQLRGGASSADACPVQIASISAAPGADAITIRVAGGSRGAGPATAADVRLHVAATHFVPAGGIGAALARGISLPGLSSSRFGPARSRTVPSRTLGEEARYIAARKAALRSSAPPVPGSALPRPSLLLNPWSLGAAATDVRNAADGTAYARHTDTVGGHASAARANRAAVQALSSEAAQHAAWAFMDFLAAPARVLANLPVGTGGGSVTIPVTDIDIGGAAAAAAGAGAGAAGAGGEPVVVVLTLVAADAATTASTRVVVSIDRATRKVIAASGDFCEPAGAGAGASAGAGAAAAAVAAGAFPAVPARDLTVSSRGLGATDHVVQSSRVTVLPAPDGALTVSASASHTKVESFGSFERVFSLFAAQSESAQLAGEWAWLSTWPALSEAEKRSRYSKYACAELHLFLFFKDQPFWRAVVRPFLACKRAKSFVDHWLLGSDLAAYTATPAFLRLNALEKALLAARIGPDAMRAAVATSLAAVVENSPLPATQREAIFKAALASSGLDGGLGAQGAALQALLQRAEAERAAAAAAGAAARTAAPTSGSSHNSMPMAPMARRRGDGAPGGGGGPRLEGLVHGAAVSMSMMRDEALDGLSLSMACEEAAPERSRAAPSGALKKGMFGGGGGGGRGGMMMRKMAAPAPSMPMPSMSSMSSMARSASPMQSQASKMDASVDDALGGKRGWGGDDDDDGDEAEKEEAYGGGGDSDDEGGDVADMDLRSAARDRALYRPLDKTEEYAETHYWRVRSEEDVASLVTPNEFWADFAGYCSRIGTAAGAAAAASGAASEAAMEAMAAAIAASPFVSAHVGVVAARSLPIRLPVGEAGASDRSHASGRFALNQMLLALAVIGLPFECAPATLPRPAAPAVTALPGGAGLRFASAGTPLIVFHQDLSKAAVPGAGAAAAGGAAGAAAGAENGILCGQSYFDPSERSEVIRGVSREKYLPFAAAGGDGVRAVSMLRGKVYGCSAVITNVGSVSQAIDVLLHLPQGAVPVQGSKVLRTHSLRLSPYSTQRFEYTFTLPRAGTFDHYPVHVSRAAGEDGEGGAGGAPVLLAFAAPTRIAAVEDSAVGIDRASWLWVSQMGTLDEVLTFMRNPATSLASLELHRILWRCGEGRESWTTIIDLLRSRHHFDEGVWAYGIAHGDSRAVTELLAFDRVRARIAEALGPFPVIAAPLLRTAAEPFVGSDAASASGRTLCPRSTPLSVWSGALRSGQLYQAAYEHLEYSPLINARAHVLGERREILNEAVLTRYRTLISVLAAKAPGEITAADRLAVVYHLLLQDRVNEARTVFAAVPAPADSVAARPAAGAGAGAAAAAAAAAAGADGSWMTLQYDYCVAYLDLLAGPVEEEDPAAAAAAFPLAAAVAAAYAAYPVPKWTAKFAEVGELVAQVRAMAAGGAAAPGAAAAAIGSGASHDETGTSKELSRERQAARGAALEPTLSLRTRGSNVVIAHANLPKAALSFYGMDIEPLFSTAAFSIAASAASGASRAPAASPSSSSGSAGGLGQFAFVRPNRSMPVALTAGSGSAASAAAAGGAGAGAAAAEAGAAGAAGGAVETVVPLPADLAKRNMLVVASAGGLRASTPYFANDIAVTVAEAFGRLRVTHASTGAPLPRVYVKVFWRESAGDSKGKFYKDGYTSSSGAFDYAALSTDELSRTQRFAILVLSEEHGSVVLTAAPPKA